MRDKAGVEQMMVPEAGLEPARREAMDFESIVSTIPPLGHMRGILI